MNCIACTLEDKRIRAKNAPAHICAKSRKDYKEPETTIYQGNSYYKTYIHDLKVRQDDFDVFRLESQYLNGYKVKRFTEIVISKNNYIRLPHQENMAWIWLKKKFYDKLVFL